MHRKLRRSILLLIRAPSWPEGKWLFRNDRLREMSLLLASSIAIITVARRRLSLALMNRITLLPRRSSYVCNCTKETKASKSHRWLSIMRRWLWCNKRFCFEENLESKVQANMVLKMYEYSIFHLFPIMIIGIEERNFLCLISKQT